MDRDRFATRLVLHGAVVFGLGMLSGIPFGYGIVESQPEAFVRAWKLAHLEGLTNGLVLWVLAAVTPRLDLPELAWRMLGWALGAMAYGNIVGAMLAAGLGHRGLAPEGPVGNWIPFSVFGVAMVGTFVAVPLVGWGAWRRLQPA